MAGDGGDFDDRAPWEEREVDDAARQAACIGGDAGVEYLDPSDRPVIEAGQGVAEGFELAEADLTEAAEMAGGWANPRLNPFASEVEARDATPEYSEADHESSSERLDDDK